MNVTIPALRDAVKMLLNECYSQVSGLDKGHYSFDDILDQVVFELIKEEYKRYAEKHTIQYYLDLYDSEYYGTSRKYTRSIQHTQFYRDWDNSSIEEIFGFRLPELEAQDMSGSNKFTGYQFTEQEFLQIKMQAECKLLNKLHGKQIDNSHNVSEIDFGLLFGEYANQIAGLEPPMDINPNSIISRIFAYYGIETHFLTEFLYRLTLTAEEQGYPKEVPVDRILSVCGITPFIPATSWCPEVFFADLCILPRWGEFGKDIFTANDEEWNEQESLLLDCKRMKNIVLQRRLEKWVEWIHFCSPQEKAGFLAEHYWLWDYSPDYKWTSERIRYYRKLHNTVMQDFPKPQIK